MKAYRTISLFLLLLLTLGMSAGAANRQAPYLPGMEEYEEIGALLPEIVPELNGILEEEGYLVRITPQDIPLAEGYPIYLNENYFSPEIASPADFLSLVEAQERYVWKLPVDLGGEVMLVGLGKGYPVRKGIDDPAIVSEIEEKAGKWSLATVEFVTRSDLLPQRVRDAGIDADQVFFVHGPTGSSLLMAVCLKDGAFQEVLSFADAEISGAHQSFVSKAGEHYSYQGLQASAGALIDEINHTDAFAEYSPTALILLGMAAILFFLKKKSRKTHHATQI